MLDFTSISIKLASPQNILGWSHGEITKPETINYRTQKPEKDGLFSERIFGPTKDWECYCGKYRRVRYKGIICDKCGVEVTHSKVRRERMGHINLAAPVAHIWFLRSIPSRISIMLNLPMQALEKVIYYINYIITSVDEEKKQALENQLEKQYQSRTKSTDKNKKLQLEVNESYKKAKLEIAKLKPLSIISELDYYNLSMKYSDVFEADIGSEPIKRLLEKINLKTLIRHSIKELKDSRTETERKKILMRLKLSKNLLKKNLRPEWMFFDALPVLPPDLRPMVALEGGRYATSDLNDLYRRVINRNNRLKKLLHLKAPEVIIKNEKRMLQEAVDALIDNSARQGTNQPMSAAQKRPLRSLTDMLKGKQGRFRQNLLGKRVDYSGRSVIVVGPELNFGECGLPKIMALELFKPFVIQNLIQKNIVYNIKAANHLIQEAPPEVWEALEEVIEGRYVLLNRAPTLHRLSVQSFKPVLIEDLAIRIHPLVCSAFNADFDGDQMAVHLPLTEEAQTEAREIMYSKLNLLKPATGDPVIAPSQDIILGCYYLTRINEKEDFKNKIFSPEEAIFAYEMKMIKLDSKIKIKESGKKENSIISTSVGRIIFNSTFPDNYDFINDLITKPKLSKICSNLIDKYGVERAAEIVDKIKNIGYVYATKSGISWGLNDLTIPTEKKNIMTKAQAKIDRANEQYQKGLLTAKEKQTKSIEIWKQASSSIADLIPHSLDKTGPVYAIVNSGARGSWAQASQMAGLKGLVQNPKGEIIELPVKSSFKEGFNVLEYFISTHGARKGSTDTALKTSSAGYLTRRLVDVAQDVVIREIDCQTKEGIIINRNDGKEFGHSFISRLFSRTAINDLKIGKKTIIKAGEIIDKKTAEEIDASEIQEVIVRSPIACKTLYGICSKCYGYDLGHNQLIKEGQAAGIVAAQAIGEPGTQLTMRTFHYGGVAGTDITHGLPRVQEIFEVRPPKSESLISEVFGKIKKIDIVGTDKIITIETKKQNAEVETKKPKLRKNKKEKTEKETIEYRVPKSIQIYVKENEEIIPGQQITEGHINLRKLLKAAGPWAIQKYILQEVQKVYISNGTNINNKHIEIIIRQMFSKVKIKSTGDSDFVVGEIVEKSRLIEENRALTKAKKKPALAQQLVLGITKVSLKNESFLSAASFQETARVLIEAATERQADNLRGLKENVIIGRLIPAGTGYGKEYKNQNGNNNKKE